MTVVSATPYYFIERKAEATVLAPEKWAATAHFREPKRLTFTLTQPAAAWLNNAIQRVSDLTALADDWDSYRAKAVSAEAAIDAVQLLLKVTRRFQNHPSFLGQMAVCKSSGIAAESTSRLSFQTRNQEYTSRTEREKR